MALIREMVSANLLKEVTQPGASFNMGWQSIGLEDKAVTMMKVGSVQFSVKARGEFKEKVAAPVASNLLSDQTSAALQYKPTFIQGPRGRRILVDRRNFTYFCCQKRGSTHHFKCPWPALLGSLMLEGLGGIVFFLRITYYYGLS